MRFHINTSIRVLISLLVTLPLAMASMAQELRIDGKVRIAGAPLEGTRAILVSEDGDELILDKGLAHFNEVLRMNTRYLLSVEREGCVTKQVLINTHLPEDQLSSRTFTFLFLVTLGLITPGHPFEYAGPVGYVRYMAELDDFGYDTDYSIKPDTLLRHRMERFTAVTIAVYQPDVQATPDPVVPLIDPVAATMISFPASEPEVLPLRDLPLATLTPLSRIAVPSVHARPVPAAVALIHAPAVQDRQLTSMNSTRAHDVRLPDARIEWTQVEPRRVTTVVRITREGRVIEYRRVATYSGTVYYFIDGASCSEWSHTAGVEGITWAQ